MTYLEIPTMDRIEPDQRGNRDATAMHRVLEAAIEAVFFRAKKKGDEDDDNKNQISKYRGGRNAAVNCTSRCHGGDL